ncbi:MAG: hypothetical protein PWR01_3269, partial [Clostridiales bacterium]|nr:hypothetical protein [Clostridiales bacterium]MDN5282196.1 hypothetical protein [Candidatus Ozemobacter sp.]
VLLADEVTEKIAAASEMVITAAIISSITVKPFLVPLINIFFYHYESHFFFRVL